MGNGNDNFTQNKLLDIEDTERYWIGVESWTVTDQSGTKTTRPGLVKREKVKDRQTGEYRPGKAKAFSLADLALVEARLDEIRGYLTA